MNGNLPHAGEESVGVGGIHGEFGAAGVFVDEEDLLPGFSAIVGAENSALVLRTKSLADSTNKSAVRIVRIYNDARDVACLFEADVLPASAGVSAFVNAIAHGVIRTNQPGLASARVNYVVSGGGHGQRADRGDIFVIKNGLPVGACVGSFPDSAVGRADVDNVGISRLADDCGDAIAFGANKTEMQSCKRIIAVFRLSAAALGVDA